MKKWMILYENFCNNDIDYVYDILDSIDYNYQKIEITSSVLEKLSQKEILSLLFYWKNEYFDSKVADRLADKNFHTIVNYIDGEK